jgi:hypothetical protein
MASLMRIAVGPVEAVAGEQARVFGQLAEWEIDKPITANNFSPLIEGTKPTAKSTLDVKYVRMFSGRLRMKERYYWVAVWLVAILLALGLDWPVWV